MIKRNESTLFEAEDYKCPVTRELEERIMDYCLLLCEYQEWKNDSALLKKEVESSYITRKEKEYGEKLENYADIKKMELSRNEIHFYSIMACGRNGNYDIAKGMLKTNTFISVFVDAFNAIAMGEKKHRN